MLRNLSISNFGLIEQLELPLEAGFVCLTGETGAGKSMLVDGVLAVFGSKLDQDRIRAGAKTAHISLFFELTTEQTTKLTDLGLVIDDAELLLAREIPLEGRSRIWANGVPISFTLAKQVGSQLLENIGQHEGQALLDPNKHLYYLDEMGGLIHLRESCAEALLHWKRADSLWKIYLENQASQMREIENLIRELAEIEASALKLDEDTRLKERRQILKSHGALTEALGKVLGSLLEDGGAQFQIAEAFRYLETAGTIDSQLQNYLSSLGEVLEILSDLGREIANYTENLIFVPGELEDIEERLDLIERLGKRFGLGANAILDYAQQARLRLETLATGTGSKDNLEKDLQLKKEQLEKVASRLHQEREKFSSILETKIMEELACLAMTKAKFSSKVALRENSSGNICILDKTVNVDESGPDELEYLFTANPGEPLRPLSKVASGGELSRLMLAFKTISAASGPVSTLVFDEVDVGIGGNTANVVGERLRRLSEHNQVLVVTHLPQIAARANLQIAIEKEEVGGRTLIRTRILTDPERLLELARMLGGGQPPTDATLGLAKELLSLR